MRICSKLAGAGILTACAVWAASPSVQPSSGLTSVIRTDPRTGKLVRAVAVHNPAALNVAVDRVAAEHALPSELVHSVVRAESNYNPNAVSPKGAQGLMQLVPATARRFGVADAFNPLQNLEGGAKYLKYLLDLYHGDYTLALAAYNAGEQTVARYGGVPPYRETQNYVAEVSKRLPKTQKPSEAKPKPPAVAVDPSVGVHIQEIVLPDGSVRYVARQL
jgi:soluble lytic murein transglycosylase-like protein